MPSPPVWTQLPTNTPREQGYIRLVCGKRPMSIERDLCLSKETYTYVERDPTHIHTSRAGRGALQHTATHCNTLVPNERRERLTATHYNALKRKATQYNAQTPFEKRAQRTASHCSTPQRTGLHCSTHTHMSHAHIFRTHTYFAHRNISSGGSGALQRNTTQHYTTHCNKLQYTHLNTLCQYTNLSAIHKSQHTMQHTVPIHKSQQICVLQCTNLSRCNTQISTHNATPQHTVQYTNLNTHCNTPLHTATHCKPHTPVERMQRRTSTKHNTLQHTATHTHLPREGSSTRSPRITNHWPLAQPCARP